MVHGCIDGYRRTVVYLRCNTDNTSATVLKLFEEAVFKWGLLLRVRGGMGVENRDVAYYMMNHSARGPGRGSYITGRSVRNSRIERLWRDVFQTVLSVSHDLFVSLESLGYLDPDNEEHLFCLQYVYHPGGTVASWVARSTPERALRVRALSGDIVLCSWGRHFTLTVPLSTKIYKWVPANLMLGGNPAMD